MLFAKKNDSMADESRRLAPASSESDGLILKSYETITTRRNCNDHVKNKYAFSGEGLEVVSDIIPYHFARSKIKKIVLVGVATFLLTFVGVVFYNTENVGNVLERKVTSSTDMRDLQSRETELPVMVGNSIQVILSDDMLLGGFKLNTENDESPFKGHPLKCDDFSERIFDTDYTTWNVIKSEEDLNRGMNIHGSLSMSYGPMKEASAAESYIANTVSTENRVIVEYTSRRSMYVRGCKEDSIKPSNKVNKLIEKNKISKIYDRFGSKYVDQIMYGQQLSIKYAVTSESTLDATEIGNEVSRRIGSGSFKGEFAERFDSTKMKPEEVYHLSIDVALIGSNVPVPSTNDFEEIDAFLVEVNNDGREKSRLYDENKDNADLNILTPIRFTLEETSNHIDALDANEAVTIGEKVRELSNTWQTVLFFNARLAQVDDNLDKLFHDGRDRNIYHTWLEKEKEVKVVLDKKLVECLDYRKLDVAMLIGTDVPEQISYKEIKSFDGLLGNGFVQSPIVLNEVTYDVYWVGYVLDGEPFYKGTVGCYYDYFIIAGPNTIEELSSHLSAGMCKARYDNENAIY